MTEGKTGKKETTKEIEPPYKIRDKKTEDKKNITIVKNLQKKKLFHGF